MDTQSRKKSPAHYKNLIIIPKWTTITRKQQLSSNTKQVADNTSVKVALRVGQHTRATPKLMFFTP